MMIMMDDPLIFFSINTLCTKILFKSTQVYCSISAREGLSCLYLAGGHVAPAYDSCVQPVGTNSVGHSLRTALNKPGPFMDHCMPSI